MVSQPYADDITDTMTHDIAATPAARPDPGRRRHIQPPGALRPDRRFRADAAVATSRDGHTFAGEAESMDARAGEVTIRLPGSWPRELPVTRSPRARASAAGALTPSRAITGHRHSSLYPAGSCSNCTRQSRELRS